MNINAKFDWPEIQYDTDRNLYPTLIYNQLPSIQFNLENKILGGNYNILSETPWFHIRYNLCDHRFFPYELDTNEFKVRNGIMIKPNPTNLHVYTDKKNCNVLYFSIQRKRFIGKLIFEQDHLELIEFV